MDDKIVIVSVGLLLLEAPNFKYFSLFYCTDSLLLYHVRLHHIMSRSITSNHVPRDVTFYYGSSHYCSQCTGLNFYGALHSACSALLNALKKFELFFCFVFITLPVATSFKKSSNVCIGLEPWAGFVNKNKCMYLCRKFTALTSVYLHVF